MFLDSVLKFHLGRWHTWMDQIGFGQETFLELRFVDASIFLYSKWGPGTTGYFVFIFFREPDFFVQLDSLDSNWTRHGLPVSAHLNETSFFIWIKKNRN